MVTRTYRRAERRGLGSPGWISFHGDARFPCFILDISQDGAKIAVREAFTLPDRLRLYFSPTAQTFRLCVVRWRKEEAIAVQFTRPRPRDADGRFDF
jgi:hypothetical protein